MPTTNPVDDIRRQMAEIRMDMHREIRSVRAGTEAATSLSYYARHYPWVMLSAAAALGYFLVPRRRDTTHVVVQQPIEAGETPAQKRRKRGLIGLALGFLGPIAVRAAQGYAVNYLDSMLARSSVARPPGEDAAYQPESGPFFPH